MSWHNIIVKGGVAWHKNKVRGGVAWHNIIVNVVNSMAIVTFVAPASILRRGIATKYFFVCHATPL